MNWEMQSDVTSDPRCGASSQRHEGFFSVEPLSLSLSQPYPADEISAEGSWDIE
jgi:hypothetical protein